MMGAVIALGVTLIFLNSCSFGFVLG